MGNKFHQERLQSNAHLFFFCFSFFYIYPADMYKLQHRSIQDIRQAAIGQLLFLPDSFEFFKIFSIVCVLFSHHHLIRHFSAAFSAHLSSSERHTQAGVTQFPGNSSSKHYILSKSQKTLVLPIREKSARARQKVMR